MSKLRANGPVALFDLGDDLTVHLPVPADDRARQELRADLIVRAMTDLHYDGWVVGERDLAFGLDRLRKAAQGGQLPLLSSNLAPVAGDNPFIGHLEVQTGALKVCAVAVHGKGDYGIPALRIDYGPEVTVGDSVAAVQRELATLAGHPCDVKILLAHMDRGEADRLLKEVSGFDAVVLGHQGQQLSPQRSGEVLIVGDGAKGREVGVLELGLADGSMSGPLADQGERAHLQEVQTGLEKQIAELEKRLKTAPEASQTSSQRTLEMLQGRLADNGAKLKEVEHRPEPRLYSFEWASLGTDVADDPQWKAAVDAFVKDHPEPAPAPPPPARHFALSPDGGVLRK